MSALQTTSLTKRFGEFVAVDDLDLDVESGEVYGFLGPNGAGKSTTIDMLLGFLDPSEGSATVLGHDATRESRAVRQRTGLLPDGLELYENLTGREHVASAIETKGASDDPDDLIERVGLAPEAARRRTGGYSKGMKQRLGLAIALVGSPDLLVLDEPSSGLDPEGIKRLRRIVEAEADRGATVFFSSHILEQVEKVCDRVGIMSDGELVAVDTIENLRAELSAESVIEADVDGTPNLAAVEAVDGVTTVSERDDTVELTVARPPAKMPALRALDDTASVVDVTIDDASLETLFERYTNGDGTPAEGSEEAAATGEGATADVGGESA
ncbi:ABC transporter ATP-binding protein [Salarchaeum sp. JOR-1]|uniref:ABC transporter ATP-binding protein n=1 Tax=Salarchaeum sp. JOR-1 TaxID=2599399 RepID=UPI00119894ED|nr:ABC transporter ATP-binding protein [Salarchaeum sp. JOR-1]QDX40180.1 ABC transporter ATP-binding protein [Salarchaeum sp. JOR-1]